MDAQSWDKRYTDAELVWSADPNQFFALHRHNPGGAILVLSSTHMPVFT
jgi:hypothetical protein